MPREQRHQQVHSITGAQASLDDDLGPRMRRYLISMSVRTVCFVLAVAVEGPMRWVFAALAIVLPYVAVVAANAGPRRIAPVKAYVPPKNAVDDGSRRRIEP